MKRVAASTGAVIIGGDKHALGIARSLGRRGIPVAVVAERGPLVGVTSRFVSRTYRWPELGEERRVAFLVALGQRRLAGWTLYATEDWTSELVALHGARLQRHFRLTVPTHETAMLALDKRQTYELARSAGLDVPWTYHGSTLPDKTPLPAVVKAASKRSDNALTRDRAWRADSREQLEALHRRAAAMVPPDEVIVQELLPGDGTRQFSFAGVFADGRPVGTVVARRLRQYPVDFGHSSSHVVTCEHREVEEAGLRMIAAMRYTGIAELEFKQDARDGRPRLLDVNPRVWTWHELARRAGVDVPYLAWQVSRGERPPAVRARAGVRWVRMATDVPAAIAAIRCGTLRPREYLASIRPPVQGAVFAYDDPLPALLDLPIGALRSWRAR